MMKGQVRVVEATAKSLELRLALLLYQSSEQHVYATVHNVSNHPTQEGAKLIGPGKPASKEALASFAGAVNAATSYRGMVPENLLYIAPNAMAWWTPPAVRRVWFASNDAAIMKQSAEVHHPGLVFVARRDAWFVFAVDIEQGRPTAKTMLYKAPYFNVWDDGKICTGNADVPDHIGPGTIGAYEDAFFRSRFTHSNDKKLVKFPGGSTALWAAQLANPTARMLLPKYFVPRKETLERAIQRIIGDY